MSEINCTNCAISDFKESLCERCDKMKRIGSADDIEKLIIRCLPSAQPEPSQVARDIATIIENEQDMRVIERNAQQWIPCSERLPDIHDEVLVTARGEVSIAWRSNDMPQPMFGDVIAWMPLPEPYKGEQE